MNLEASSPWFSMRMINEIVAGVKAAMGPRSVLRINPSGAKLLILRQSPSVFALMNAGWRAGYTVNGIPPN